MPVGLCYPGTVFVGRPVCGHRASDALSPRRERQGRVERGEDPGDAARGVLALVLDVMRDHEERMTDVVEADDGVVDRERRFRQAEDIS